MNGFDISIFFKAVLIICLCAGVQQITFSNTIPKLNELVDTETCQRRGDYFSDNNSVSIIMDIKCPNDTDFRTISFPCYDSCDKETFEENLDSIYSDVVVYTFSPNNYRTIAGYISARKTETMILGTIYISIAVIGGIVGFIYSNKKSIEENKPIKKKNTRRSVV